jgi:hypothetical protein
VPEIARLITFADAQDWPGQPAGQVSCSAILEAELADGRRIVLLDDRGWSEGLRVAGGTAPPDQWSGLSREDLEETARTVVGPDEPVGGESQEDAARTHWSALAGVLRRHGVPASGDDLRSVPHVVVLSGRLLERIAGPPGS